MLSKERINPIFPKDFSTIIREGRCAVGSAFTPGTVVVRVNGLLVRCDADTALHRRLPAEIVWTDGSTRNDAQIRHELDGTVREEVTTICGDFIAEVAAAVFVNTPNPGEYIMKSSAAGRLVALNQGQVSSDMSTDHLTRWIGQVIGAAEDKPGFYLCKFRL